MVMRQSYEFKGNVIPDYIKLPNGIKVPVDELTNQVSNYKHHKLKTFANNVKFGHGQRDGFGPGRPSKYSHDERLWMSMASVDDICIRYKCDRAFARMLMRTTASYMKSYGKLPKGD